MKKFKPLLFISLTIILISACFPMISTAEKKGKAKIQFEETVYDFGIVKENGGPVTHIFKFKNVGDGNLVIYSATAQCGCTKPSFSEEAIAPGKTGEIKVTYNPKGRPGGFRKDINVRSNGNPNKVTLRITGTVAKEVK